MSGFKVSVRRIAEASTRLQIEALEDYRELMKRGRQDKADELDERLQEVDPEGEHAEVLADERQILGDIQDLADEMAIIGLYRIVELHLKKLAVRLYPAGSTTKFRNVKGVQDDLSTNHNLDINNLNRFDEIDELRVLNNAIKHQREVTQELAKFSGWTKGEELKNLDYAFDRLKPAVKDYLEDFGNEIDKRIFT